MASPDGLREVNSAGVAGNGRAAPHEPSAENHTNRRDETSVQLPYGETEPRLAKDKTLAVSDLQFIVDQAFETTEQDNEAFLQKFEKRVKAAGIKLPAVEVRFHDLSVDTMINVGSRALPTNLNAYRNVIEDALVMSKIIKGSKRHFNVLNSTSGVLKPGRMTLLLGPPGGGKSSLLKALAGKLQSDSSVKIQGSITYNGETFDQFVPQRTSAYIPQVNAAIAELTVAETLDFAARTQGTGLKRNVLDKLRMSETQRKVDPDPTVEAFLHASALHGKRYNAVTYFVMRLLGLEVCADTPIGNVIIRGISGGQKKRVTTGDKLVGPCSTLFMDEISTGLDSSTAYLVVKCIRNFVHMTQGTVLMALLQPPPEVYNLFDDIMLLCEGQVVYHGPKESVMPFFESMGFKLPARKDVADFLQEVTNTKDQGQYWSRSEPHQYVPVRTMAAAFQQTSIAKQNRMDLEAPQIHAAAGDELDPLQRTKYALGFKAQFKANLRRELILVERHSFVYIFRFTQIAILSVLTGAFFWRGRRHRNTVTDGNEYGGALFFLLINILFDGFTEMALTIDILPIYFKQRDDCMAFVLPNNLLRLPYSVGQAVISSSIMYWMVGFTPDAGRFFTFIFLMFLTHQLSCSLFRLLGALGRNLVVGYLYTWFLFLVIFLLGGYVLDRQFIHPWYIGGYWATPLQYIQNAVFENEFTAPRWNHPNPLDPAQTVGQGVLAGSGFRQSKNWVFWTFLISVGYIVLLDSICVVALIFLKPYGQNRAPISEEILEERETRLKGGEGSVEDVNNLMRGRSKDFETGNGSNVQGVPSPNTRSPTEVEVAFNPPSSAGTGNVDQDGPGKTEVGPIASQQSLGGKSQNGLRGASKRSMGSDNPVSWREGRSSIQRKDGARGMVLPFDPLAMTFRHIYYSVDLPADFDASLGTKVEGCAKQQYEILKDVSGAFRPGILTCLMGVSGAGKTTLMDVLMYRKTGGHMRGDVFIDGHPMNPTMFTRVSGYVEQEDIHSPALTIRESFKHSAEMRLVGVTKAQLDDFVDEVLDLMELQPLRDAHVGTPGISGLSVEQRKRLTIGVELVANPSLIFMDEPTSGLDARAAAIVMRTVKNTVLTGRTVVCTIHQPSIDIFEAFDELVLLKRGGRVMYTGPTGHNSKKMVAYFENIPDVPPLKDGINPATWMLEISTVSAEERLGRDFADLYDDSELHRRNEAMIEELTVPKEGSVALSFQSRYAQSTWNQFLLLVKKFNIMWWRTPEYNAVRMFFTIVFAFLLGSIFWRLGSKRTDVGKLNNVLIALLSATLFFGSSNASTIQPVVDTERAVFYRERGAGYYSSYPYAAAQFLIEIPYIFVQTVLYCCITYFTIYFVVDAGKFFWYFFFEFLSLLYFSSWGIICVAITPNVQVATIISTAFYSMAFLSAGFILPRPKFPGWVVWMYYINPVTYSVWGFVGSQLGDINDEKVQVPGTPVDQQPTVAQYIHETYKINHDFLGQLVAILFGYIIVFLGIAAFALKKFNFQTK